MGLTELAPGSVWNTMPAYTHTRRMEAYYYFNLAPKCNLPLNGEPLRRTPDLVTQTSRPSLLEWSIHAAAGTSNYTFIWGMGGEKSTATKMKSNTQI